MASSWKHFCILWVPLNEKIDKIKINPALNTIYRNQQTSKGWVAFVYFQQTLCQSLCQRIHWCTSGTEFWQHWYSRPQRTTLPIVYFVSERTVTSIVFSQSLLVLKANVWDILWDNSLHMFQRFLTNQMFDCKNWKVK